MKDKQSRIHTQNTLVRAFFDGFANGVIDANNLKQGEQQPLIKALLNFYEKVSSHYAFVMMPILGVIHHESLEQLQPELDAQRTRGNADVAGLFKVICGEERVFQAMVNAYKANFDALLRGSVLQGLNSETDNEGASEGHTRTNEEQNIRLLVRTILRAYSCGLQTKSALQQFKQTTVIRMVLDNVDLLVNGKPTIAQHVDKAKDLHDLFLAVVHTQERYNVIQEELQLEMERLTKTDN